MESELTWKPRSAFFGVSFALGEGDGFSTAKIHFGLANDF